MEYWPIVLGAVALVLLVYIFAQILVKPIKILWKLLLNSGIGLLLIVFVNFIGQLYGFALPLNFITVLIAGFLGIPGVLLLIGLEFLLR